MTALWKKWRSNKGDGYKKGQLFPKPHNTWIDENLPVMNYYDGEKVPKKDVNLKIWNEIHKLTFIYVVFFFFFSTKKS